MTFSSGILALCVLLALSWLLAGRASPEVSGHDTQKGKAVYEERCAVCHGLQGKGDGPEAPFLSPRPASLVSAGTSAKSDRELLNTIAKGKPRTAMPGWEDKLTDDELKNVLAYIRSLIQFQRSLTPPPPAAPQ